MTTVTETRNLLKNSGSHHVTIEAAVFLKHLLDHLGQLIACEANQVFEQLNNRRERQGLPRLKRINTSAVAQAYNNIKKQLPDNTMGFHSFRIESPGDKNMSVNEKIAKTRKEEDGAAEVKHVL